MRLTILNIAFLLSIIHYSCQSPEVVVIPSVAPKLVVNMIGSTEKSLSGKIGVSRGTLDYFSPITPAEATVMLYEDGQLKETLTPPENEDGFSDVFYSGNIIPSPGKTYSIKVESPSYKAVSSTYTQPLPVEIDSFNLLTLNRSGNRGYDVQVEFSFTDIPGKNYYQAFILGSQKPNDGWEITFPVTPTSLDSKYSYWPNGASVSSILFDDSGSENKRTTVIFKGIAEYGSVINENIPINYTLYFRNITEEYYKYLVTYSLQYSTKGDPYAQPVKIENNITNGFGIFGGATNTAKTISVSH